MNLYHSRNMLWPRKACRVRLRQRARSTMARSISNVPTSWCNSSPNNKACVIPCSTPLLSWLMKGSLQTAGKRPDTMGHLAEGNHHPHDQNPDGVIAALHGLGGRISRL